MLELDYPSDAFIAQFARTHRLIGGRITAKDSAIRATPARTHVRCHAAILAEIY